MSEKKCVAVIFGGQSPEHEVSRVSAQSIINNIDRNKYDVVMIGITKQGKWLPYEGPVEKLGTGEWQALAESGIIEAAEMPDDTSGQRDTGACTSSGSIDIRHPIPEVLTAVGGRKGKRKIDIVFPVLHGCNGEDGTIQGLFELAGIPYVGSGVLASAVAMDKAYAKIIFEKEGLNQAKYLVFSRKQINGALDSVIEKIEQALGYPCFVKPSNAGSSVGVSKAHDRDELVEGLKLAAQYDERVLAEEFIDGREVECAVLGNDDPLASTVGEIIPCNEFYDYEAKYDSKSTSKIIIPAELPQETINTIREYAVRAFKALDCAGLARVDFFVHRKTGRVYINEVNTMPGFTSISMYPKLWEASGISYTELVNRLIELAFERYEDKKRSIDNQ